MSKPRAASDAEIAAAIAASQAAHDARERARPPGDGMAILAPTFMDFSGPRTVIEPDGSGSRYGDVASIRSKFEPTG